MKHLYVVYRENNGALNSMNIEIDGKINIDTITQKIKVGLYRSGDKEIWEADLFEPLIISWQEIEPFTNEERDKFMLKDGEDDYYGYWWLEREHGL